ncbi:MAG: hypothetical protein IT463_03830 [Planctomycetes bacterium]|nr:hypothetical protein [Planctomycetota bacterium]
MDVVLSMLGLVGGLGGLAFGLFQYYRAQRLRSAEFAANEVLRWVDLRETRMVMGMLEWVEREVALEYVDGSSQYRHELVRNDEMAAALVPHTERQLTAKECAIRALFDRFLFGLQRFEHFMAAGVVRQSDFEPFLRYYIELMGRTPSPRMPAASQEALWRYLDFYEQRDVQRLFARFGCDVKPRK